MMSKKGPMPPNKRTSGPYEVHYKDNSGYFYPLIQGPGIKRGVVMSADGMANALNTAYEQGRRSVEAKKGRKK